MNLFELILRNSHYYNPPHKSVEEKKERYKESKCFDKSYYIFVESLVPHLLCPISIIEEFLGEKYDFKKHVQPLINEGLIWIRPAPPQYQDHEYFVKNHGIVRDYKTDYLQFHIGKVDPNKDRKFETAWI